ncbi:multidrug MFS transporter [Paenibacillus rhizosphaerae]|uniref:Multidrug MFS transporter n=1 Tax=Paenibacillus rhizosphaerae TaxID=297318 RepID=A0A1R1F552_9BACL|nr:multidrug MFS transporter [Paenibacillus rhizosphaerae]
MTPFKINVPQSDLEDLKMRLDHTRWPDEAAGEGWNMGADLGYMKELIDYWRTQYDWRIHEAKLNALPQYKTVIEDTTLHFVQVRSENPNAVPLLLVHGWPDSFYRFHKMIPLLSDSFDLVVPSIPGFGFSDRKTTTPKRVAHLFAKLMTETLGYEGFATCGGDIGTEIVTMLSTHHSDVVKAILLTDAGYPTGSEDITEMSPADRQFMLDTQTWVQSEGAYLKLQATKPQTLAYSLNDSPVGLASWIVGMIRSGAGDETVDDAFGGRDELLTNIMIYWLTGTAGSAARMYRLIVMANQANVDSASPVTATRRVPASIVLFPREIQFPSSWAERSVHVCSYNKMPCGGHFAALEKPELLANELIRFIPLHYFGSGGSS